MSLQSQQKQFVSICDTLYTMQWLMRIVCSIQCTVYTVHCKELTEYHTCCVLHIECNPVCILWCSRQKVEDETNHLQCFVFNGLNYCVEQSPTNPTSRIHLNTRIAFIQSSESLSSLAAFIPIIIIMLVGQTTR